MSETKAEYQPTDLIELWAGGFGLEYERRNTPSRGDLRKRESFLANFMPLAKLFSSQPPDKASVLEVGCGAGHNLALLTKVWRKSCCSTWLRHGVDVNPEVMTLGSQASFFKNVAPSHELPFRDGFFHVVFTVGTLIHVPPEHISKTYAELWRVTAVGGVVCLAEYFNPKPIALEYQGVPNALWKRDFGGELMDVGRSIGIGPQPVRWGHFFKAMGDYDDLAYWCVRKVEKGSCVAVANS